MSELPYLRIAGHARVRETLARAWRADRLPPTLLLTGPRGIGKQRLALWFGALALCERAALEPCGECRSCRLTGRLLHPDLHWFFPTARPRSTPADKLRDKIEEVRADELAQRRENPRYLRFTDGPSGIYLAAAQNLRAVATARPTTAARTVTVVGEADALVPQEASPEAANALLKTLEEPPATSTLILTSSVPGALLPTIRSRCLTLRVPPLPDADVARYLQDEAGLPADQARSIARRAEGSIGRALELVDEDSSQTRSDADRLLKAAVAPEPSQRLETAHQYTPWGARGSFLEVLDELQARLREGLAAAAGPEAEGLAAAILEVDAARGMAERNLNPQLIVAGLLARLYILLQGSVGPSGTRNPAGPISALKG